MIELVAMLATCLSTPPLRVLDWLGVYNTPEYNTRQTVGKQIAVNAGWDKNTTLVGVELPCVVVCGEHVKVWW